MRGYPVSDDPFSKPTFRPLPRQKPPHGLRLDAVFAVVMLLASNLRVVRRRGRITDVVRPEGATFHPKVIRSTESARSAKPCDFTTPNRFDRVTGVSSGNPPQIGSLTLIRTTAKATLSHYGAPKPHIGEVCRGFSED